MNIGEGLQNQGLVKIQRRFDSDVFDPVFPLIPEHVKSQTVLLRIDEFRQLLFQMHELLIVNGTFEYRLLDSLAEVQTRLRDVSKSTLAYFI